MSILFRNVSCPPLADFTAEAPEGVVVGLVGEDEAGTGELLRLAAGVLRPAAGEVRVEGTVRLLGPADTLDFTAVDVLLLDHALATRDALVQSQARAAIERLRRRGTTILMASHDEPLLERIADELWWLDQGQLAARGHPGEVLAKWRRHLVERLRQWGQSAGVALEPAFRRGDGRAELMALETLDEFGRPTMVWESGRPVSVRVTVRFRQPVEDPVVGIMIRTRIGFEVYGTNTELEGVRLGPCKAGETLRVLWSFVCHLCPQQYTLTAASHDPDGVWHDWLEDAVAFEVVDSRYTAGVANLRAVVRVERTAAG
ncbi:MAG: Wzt carbohydrate-binding domain-containing protein [Bryobacterales bacterium]|nr:Wzt carbohydrate-binding domain-containing protein [Bryobacteraceae bacterium]MDW8354778.1 Wzt carbohydrate-binding domain-containing protein [Bryobacterales bacterium]